MNIGILGFGTMGRMITEALVVAGNKELRIYNRSSKSSNWLDSHKLKVENDFCSIISDSDVLFLCLSPSACVDFLARNGSAIPETTVLVSIAGDLSIMNMARFFKGRILRIMPTLLTKVNSGTTLICSDRGTGEESYGPDLDAVSRIISLFPEILNFKIVSETQIDSYTTITSCGPGLMASMFYEYSRALSEKYGIGHAEVEILLKQSIQGVCALAENEHGSFEAIIKDVATSPTGITATGAKVLAERLPPLFYDMLYAIEKRHAERKNELFDRVHPEPTL